MKNSALEILKIGFVGRFVLVEEGIFDNTVAAFGTNEEVGVGSIAAEGHLAVGEQRVEVTFALEADLAAFKRLPPEAEAVVADRTNAVLEEEAGAVLITIAEVVPVFPAEIAECDTVSVVIPTRSKAVERVDVAQIVTALKELNADLNSCDTHIGKGVVHTLNKKTYRVNGSATNDIYVADITVGRAGVCAPLYVQTYFGVLDRNVFNSCFTAAIDGYAVSNVVSVDDTARKIVVASVYHYSVERLSRAKTDKRFITVPRLHSLDNGKV